MLNCCSCSYCWGHPANLCWCVCVCVPQGGKFIEGWFHRVQAGLGPRSITHFLRQTFFKDVSGYVACCCRVAF